MATRPVKLTFLGATENVPREIRGAGKACGGDFAIILTPLRGQGRVLHTVKKTTHAGVWTAGPASSDHPVRPSVLVDAAAARAWYAAGRDASPAGAATLKGSWTGTVVCTDDAAAPHFRFERKIGYVTVVIESVSVRAGEWAWIVHAERKKQWFGVDSVSAKVQRRTLREAMITAADLSADSAREVCGAGATTRRSAVDTDYAAKHPAAAPKAPSADPIEAMLEKLARIPALAPEKKPAKTRGKAAAAPPDHAPGSAAELAAGVAGSRAALTAAIASVDAAEASPTGVATAATYAAHALQAAGAVAAHPANRRNGAGVATAVSAAAEMLQPALQRPMRGGDWKRLRESLHQVTRALDGETAMPARRGPAPAPAARVARPEGATTGWDAIRTANGWTYHEISKMTWTGDRLDAAPPGVDLKRVNLQGRTVYRLRSPAHGHPPGSVFVEVDGGYWVGPVARVGVPSASRPAKAAPPKPARAKPAARSNAEKDKQLMSLFANLLSEQMGA